MKQGFLLIEALVAIVLLSIVVVSVFPTLDFMVRRSKTSTFNVEANLLLQEGIEVPYNIFLGDWSAMGSDPQGQYKTAEVLESGREHWALLPCSPDPNDCTSDPDTLLEAKYRRIITLSPVLRDPVTGVQQSGGISDQFSRKIMTTISWDENGTPKSVSGELLLVNLNRK